MELIRKARKIRRIHRKINAKNLFIFETVTSEIVTIFAYYHPFRMIDNDFKGT
jgi:hypothetical protein